jgi:DNA-directed RNA polymerase subunit RPC12/RpoP
MENENRDSLSHVILIPALRQIGTAPCPICKHTVAVNLTKTGRPFVNCSFCSVRIFYNGREAIRLLRKKLKPTKEEEAGDVEQ